MLRNYTKVFFSNVYVLYTFLFLIIFFIAFYAFFSNDRSFIWQVDGLWQYYPTMHYLSRFFREIIRSAMSGIFAVPLFDFRIGLGEDVIRTFGMNIGHFTIFDYFLVFVPIRYLETVYNMIVIGRYYLAGITFIHYCRYMKTEKISILVGTLAYVFCGWMVFSVTHPQFLSAAVFLPLVLEGTERTLSGNKPYMLLIVTFIFTLSGFYFLYMVSLFLVPYVVIRVYQFYIEHNKTGNRKFLNYFSMLVYRGGYIALVYIIGILLAGYYIVPSVYSILETSPLSRTGININVDSFWFFSFEHYQNIFANFIAGNAHWWWILFPVISIPAIVWLFFGDKKNEGRKYLLVLFGFLFLLMLIPAGGWLMTGFAYASGRWQFLFSFVLSFVIVKSLPNIFNLSEKMLYLNYGFIIVYATLILFISRFRTQNYFIALTFLLVTVIFLARDTKLCKHYKTVILLFLIVCNLMINATLFNETRFSAFLRQGAVEDQYFNVPREVKPRVGEFHRIDVIPALPNAPALRDYFGISVYSNVLNPNLMQLISYMETTNRSPVFRIDDLEQRAVLNALASVRYIVADSYSINNIPFGYIEHSQFGNLTIFENQFYLPLGFTYSQAVSESFFKTLDPASKQELMLKAVVLENPRNIYTSFELNTINVPFEIEDKSYMFWQNGVLDVQRGGAYNYIHLTFESLPQSELYLRLSGLSNDYRTVTSVNVRGEILNRGRNAVFWRNELYVPAFHTNMTFNLGFSENPQTEISFTFQHVGSYELADIQLFALPLCNFSDYIETLREYTLTNIDLHEQGLPGLTNRVTGEITLGESRYLFLSIPYSNGWRAYINGNRSPILRANIAFMALELEAGHHEIELRYRTPGLIFGIFLSFVGFIGFFLIIKFHNRIISKLFNYIENVRHHIKGTYN